MASISLAVCPPGNESVINNPDGSQSASCTQGMLVYQQVDIDEAFDPSTLDSGALGDAFAAGFVAEATLLVIIIAARKVLEAVRG